MKLSISFKKETYSSYEEIKCKIQLKNQEERPFIVNKRMVVNSKHSPLNFREICFKIYNFKGEEMNFNCHLNIGSANLKDFIILKPSEFFGNFYKLSENYSLKSAGKYLIQAVYKNEVFPKEVEEMAVQMKTEIWKDELKSNIISLNIRENKKSVFELNKINNNLGKLKRLIKKFKGENLPLEERDGLWEEMNKISARPMNFISNEYREYIISFNDGDDAFYYHFGEKQGMSFEIAVGLKIPAIICMEIIDQGEIRKILSFEKLPKELRDSLINYTIDHPDYILVGPEDLKAIGVNSDNFINDFFKC